MDKDLQTFSLNPDGKTYDARKVAQWLFQVTTGRLMPDDEAEQLVKDAMTRAKARARP